jgi:predicted transcriptional regulator
MGEINEDIAPLLRVGLQRADALAALRDGPLYRAEVESELDVSRTTSHRIVTALTEHELAKRVDGRYALTVFGEFAAAEIASIGQRFETAIKLRPFFDAIASTPVDFEVSWFADSSVVESSPGDPYAPLGRFITLLKATDSLRGFDTTSIAPMIVDDIRAEIVDGMQTSIIYQPSVVAQIADTHGDELAGAMDSDHLKLYTHDALPFGLALFDERIGLGAYDDRTGMLSVFVDTNDPDAYAWGKRLYETCLEEAVPFEP